MNNEGPSWLNIYSIVCQHKLNLYFRDTLLTFFVKEKPLFLLRKSLPQLYLLSVGGGVFNFLSLPFPIFDLVHVQVIL